MCTHVYMHVHMLRVCTCVYIVITFVHIYLLLFYTDILLYRENNVKPKYCRVI